MCAAGHFLASGSHKAFFHQYFIEEAAADEVKKPEEAADMPTGDWTRGAGVFTGIGLMLALSTGLGTWAGYLLDQHWHTSPWLTLIGLFFGLGAGFLEMVRLLQRFGGLKK